MKIRNHENPESMQIGLKFHNSIKLAYSKFILLLILINFASFSFNEPHNKEQDIICTNEFCIGVYTGPEFVEGSDIAHQHSNKMSSVVGDRLKLLFEKKLYSKVDFQNIEMTTKGMGSGFVTYDLKIPFIRVKEECESYTSFDHVGGWNHAPELNKRKKQLSKALLKDDKLDNYKRRASRILDSVEE